jgi:NYN domain
VDMMTYAVDNPPPETVILISGDRDFTYGVSILRLRQYHVVIVAPSRNNTHISLTSQAAVTLDWNSEVLGKTSPVPTAGPTMVPRTSMFPTLYAIPSGSSASTAGGERTDNTRASVLPPVDPLADLDLAVADWVSVDDVGSYDDDSLWVDVSANAADTTRDMGA